jgi:4'-phosphopantetheinyl transferase
MLADREIDVWIARADVVEESLVRVLDDEERERAARFRFDADRARAIVARGALRLLLGGYLKRNPSALRFVFGPHGKPALADGALEFNVSHAGDFAAIAIAAGTPVGIDVEFEKPMSDLRAIATRFFAPAEAEAIVHAADANALFFATWVAKEAVVKAAGGGVSLGLQSFRVRAGSEELSPVENEGGDAQLDGWYVRALPPLAPGYHAAMAARGGGWKTIIRTFETGL